MLYMSRSSIGCSRPDKSKNSIGCCTCPGAHRLRWPGKSKDSAGCCSCPGAALAAVDQTSLNTVQAAVGKTPPGSLVCFTDTVRRRAAQTAVEETRPDACQHRLLQDLRFVSVSFGLTKTHDNRCFDIEAKQPKKRFVSIVPKLVSVPVVSSRN